MPARRRLTALAATAALVGPVFPARATQPASVKVERRGGVLRIASQAALVDIGLAHYRLRVRAQGRLLTGEDGPRGFFYERAGNEPLRLDRVASFQPLADGAVLTVATTETGASASVTLRWLTARTLEVTLEPPDAPTLVAVGERLRSPKSEAIYGLTERLRDSPPLAEGVLDIPADDIKPVEVGSLNRRGESVEMYVRPTFSLYAPFYQTSRGYGLAVAGTTVGLFDLAKSDPRVVSFRFETGSTPEHRRLRYYVFVGPEHAMINDEYTALTGRPFVPPDWAFLHWRWRDELAVGPTTMLDGVPVNAQVAEDVTMYEQLGISPGVYHFDRPVLQGEFGFAHFDWDATRLPNQAALLTSLRQRGYRILTWSSTWVCGANPGDNGLEAQTLGYVAPGPSGPPHCADVGGTSFILDVTNGAAQAWFRDQLRDFLAAYAIDGIKLDRGEEHIASQTSDLWADGRTGRELRNDYPRLQAKIHYDALAAAHPDGDFLLISRPAYTGTQPYAIFWGGDIPGSEGFGAGPGTDLGLRSAIISQLRAAFMGLPIWGSDTGGYYEFKDREVFARWLEFSAFSGIMEIGGKGTHAPWSMPTTPQYDQELIDIYKRYANLRATLQPYLVAAAADAGASGLPIVRPMPFFDRRDPKLRDRWDEYMFGPDLLVAPVWKVGQRSREIYFPRGTWRSYWEPTQTVRGPRTSTVAVPLDTIPVYLRGDAQVPAP